MEQKPRILNFNDLNIGRVLIPSIQLKFYRILDFYV